MALFVLLFFIITGLSHLIGTNLGGADFSGTGSRWGSVSDWFSGVVGVSIGLAGSSVAIWLAYRVERLTLAQNQMANVQAWRETYIDSGDIADRAELARVSFEFIQKIYTNLVAIEEIDKNSDIKITALRKEKSVTSEELERQIAEVLAQTYKEAEPFQREIHDAVAGLFSMLPKLQRRGASVEDILGVTDAKIKDIANEYVDPARRGSLPIHPLADRIFTRSKETVHVSDAVNLLMEFTLPYPRVLDEAAHEAVDHYPEDFAEYYWETNAKTAGGALEHLSIYLPRAILDNKVDTKVTVHWVQALCDYILDEVNPYKYAHETIMNDLQVGEVNDRQEQRLGMLSDIVINRVLPPSHYIREVFPAAGYEKEEKSKAEYETDFTDYVEEEAMQVVRPKGSLARNKLYKPDPSKNKA